MLTCQLVYMHGVMPTEESAVPHSKGEHCARAQCWQTGHLLHKTSSTKH
jgi:hypothetical protein